MTSTLLSPKPHTHKWREFHKQDQWPTLTTAPLQERYWRCDECGATLVPVKKEASK